MSAKPETGTLDLADLAAERPAAPQGGVSLTPAARADAPAVSSPGALPPSPAASPASGPAPDIVALRPVSSVSPVAVQARLATPANVAARLAGLASAGGRLRKTWRAVPSRARAMFGRSTAVSVPARRIDLGGPVPTIAGPALDATSRAVPPSDRPKPAKVKKTWREQRWERRRRRRAAEEVLGWILVPVILATCYWAAKSGLSALGTTPTALVQGIKAAMSGKGG